MITKQMNSKANIKQYSGADYPINPRQPVIARMTPVDSTANQTVINLPWTVDTVNAQDSFFISIDGKILSLGSSNDYTMTSVDTLGFSSQVTLTSPIIAGLNIQAWKLGNKKESEFAQDQRFVNLYDSMDKMFQGFVDQSTSMTATTAAGTPAAGTFYSSVTNRASMVDLRSDLKPRMAIERMMIPGIYPIQNESGPNGEIVWGGINDTANMFRAVGGSWTTQVDVTGQSFAFSTANDYMEFTFYGTGLNMLTATYSAAVDVRVSVDGGAEGSNVLSPGTSYSNALINRNYSANNPINLASGLTLGVHTVKVRTNASVGIRFYGFEILNESSSVKTNPGTIYNQGKKVLTSAQDSTSYTSGVTGTRGGRAVVYQNSDGTIGRAFQAVDAAQANYTAANHQNEELVRVYHYREFGAGRSDDFSTLGASARATAFTLDDGTTSLAGSTNTLYDTTAGGVFSNGAGDYITFTFIGTGLDIIPTAQGTVTCTYSLIVDGVTVQSGITGLAAKSRLKVVSGLPYGTHTVKLLCTAQSGPALQIMQLAVYQPKKPSIPSGAIELADYNVMADFAALTSASTPSILTVATGVLRKASNRELVFVNGTGGTQDWAQATFDPNNSTTGHVFSSDRNGSYIEYTFFGTGFQYRGNVVSSGTTLQVNLNGVAANTTNYSTLQASVYGVGLSYTTSTGAVDFGDASTQRGAGFTVYNLPLAKYTVRVSNTTASSFMNIEGLDIITPIHSAKSNLYADLQNTLPVGSNAISDNRKTTPTKDAAVQPKALAQAVGVASGPTISSTSFIPMPDMSTTIKVSSNTYLDIDFKTNFQNPAATGTLSCQIYVNGVAVGTAIAGSAINAGGQYNLGVSCNVPVSIGTHKVDVYWKVDTSSYTAVLTQRILRVKEV